jgi:GNAT superfamily N-acetyltransferase
MDLTFSSAAECDATALAALHNVVAEDLTRHFGVGPWSGATTEKGVLFGLLNSRILNALSGGAIVATLRLPTKKPWAIDGSYFTPVERALYLINMAVVPSLQRRGIGRLLIAEAVRQAQAWPANAIRLDAFDADAGAGGFYEKCGFKERGRVIYRNAPQVYFELLL